MGAWDIGPFDNDDAADWLFASRCLPTLRRLQPRSALSPTSATSIWRLRTARTLWRRWRLLLRCVAIQSPTCPTTQRLGWGGPRTRCVVACSGWASSHSSHPLRLRTGGALGRVRGGSQVVCNARRRFRPPQRTMTNAATPNPNSLPRLVTDNSKPWAQDTKRRYLIGRPCGKQLAARRGVSTIPGR